MTRIGVVGAGRVGAVLGAALRAAGHDIVAVAGESAASRTRIETLLPGVPVDKPTGVARRCDLLLLAVPDDMLPNVVNMLCASRAVRRDQHVGHTSGRHGLAVLAPAAARGAKVFAAHPAMTFTGTDVDLGRLPGSAFAVTAAPEAAEAAATVVADLGGIGTQIAEDRRALYHAGLAHGANHLVTLVCEAVELVRRSGAADPAGTLRPLLSAALDNALCYGDAALTGPIVRGDVDTVRAHVAEIDRSAPETLPSYVALARATADRAVLDGRLLPLRAAKIAGVLDAALGPNSPLRQDFPPGPAARGIR